MLKGKREADVEQAAYKIKHVVSRVVPNMAILGPSPSAILWMNKYFHWEVIVKLPTDKGSLFIEKLLDKVSEVYEYESELSSVKVRVNINVDAIR